MHRSVVIVLMCVGLMAISSRDAAAQVGDPWTDRGYVNLNIGFESVSANLTDATTRRIYDEDATFSVAQAIDSGALFDFSVGARVWRNASVGIDFHRQATDTEATVQGAVPHPVIFNRPRPFTLSVTDLSRSERAIHLQFGYMFVLTDRITAHAVLGPSFFHVSQDVISDVSVAESGNFASVNATAVITERSDSATGFNAGVDVSYELYEYEGIKIGAGALIRWAGASTEIQLLQNNVDTDLGGLHFAFGARVRF
jgi:hypothetical protein